MKVVIFEIEHYEGAFPVIKLFDMPGNEVIIYTTSKTLKRFEDLFKERARSFQWRVLPDKSRRSFFLSLYRNLRNDRPDVLYVNTISDNHWLYATAIAMAKPAKLVMTVHDINCLFESTPRGGAKAPFVHWGKRKLLAQVDEFNVVSDTMIPYLQTKTSKKTHAIPGAVFEKIQKPQQVTPPIRLVVPGSLDEKRRDYEQVFQLTERAEKAGLRIQIALLGGYIDEYGKYIAGKAKASLASGCPVLSYDTNIVDQDEFDKQMDAAHFVFIPSVIHTRICGNIPETYGVTKSSGNIFDVIKHAKPFLVPGKLVIPELLNSSAFKYENLQDLVHFLKGIEQDPTSYRTWQQHAFDNSMEYTVEKVRERNTGLFFS